MEITGQSKGERVPALLAIWGPAFLGSFLGSIIIGILGVILARVSYPNVELEQGAALVGAVCGPCFSIPVGVFVGGVVGKSIYSFLSRRNSLRPFLLTSIAAFVTGALASAVTLIPIGFVFFGLGHI